MSRHLLILLLTLQLLPLNMFSQETQGVMVEVPQDNLGEVSDVFQEHFFEALKQKAIENHDKAINELIQCLVLRPEEAVVYLELGKNFNALEKYSEAAAYLEKGRKALPGNEAMLAELYNTYFLYEDYRSALPVVKELVILDGTYAEDLVNLYILNEQFESALSLLDSLEVQKGPSTYRQGLRRQIYARTGNTDAQISDLQKDIADGPGDEQEYLNLIFVYSESGQSDKAFETAKKLLEIHPTSELVHLALYKFYISRNEPDKAVRSMEILLRSGQIDEITKYQALNDFLMYVTKDPALEKELVPLVEIFSEEEENLKVFGQLGTFFLEKGNKQQAIEYFRRALESADADYSLYRDLIGLEWEMGNYDQVKRSAVDALEIFPTQVWLYLMAGKAHNELGDPGAAETLLLSALDFLLDENNLTVALYEELAKTYTLLEDPAKAAEYLEKAGNIKKITKNE